MYQVFHNTSLRKDYVNVLNDKKNIVSVKIGTLSGYSIEIQLLNPIASSSYTYYANKEKRDQDFELLNKILKKKFGKFK